MGGDSSVGIAVSYRLDGPAIESQRGGERDFPYAYRPSLGSTQPPVQRVPGLFPLDKAARAGDDHLLPSRTVVKEIVELTSTPPLGLRGLF